ncbi:helix-turn-helix domain-containing protein [Rossellomorea sp. NPDC071047]|uniref:helix-turn-helix domain-containing protein n=1 Tax=Rossellomorea sp. NPDC071047 TaxID=3390675 RepID=UPI003D024AD1
MAKIIWKLDRVLEDLDISPNRLSVEAKVRPNTIYNMVYNEAVRFHFDTVIKVLVALNEIADQEGIHKEYNIGDILEFKN